MSDPTGDVTAATQGVRAFAAEVGKMLAPAARAFAEFTATMAQLVSVRLAARGLTWGQVAHLSPDRLTEVVWGDATPTADELRGRSGDVSARPWACCSMHDPAGRRGIWFRSDEAGPGGAVTDLEACSGREGDDCHVRLRAGQTLTAADLSALRDVLHTGRWMVERARLRILEWRVAGAADAKSREAAEVALTAFEGDPNPLFALPPTHRPSAEDGE